METKRDIKFLKYSLHILRPLPIHARPQPRTIFPIWAFHTHSRIDSSFYLRASHLRMQHPCLREIDLRLDRRLRTLRIKHKPRPLRRSPKGNRRLLRLIRLYQVSCTKEKRICGTLRRDISQIPRSIREIPQTDSPYTRGRHAGRGFFS